MKTKPKDILYCNVDEDKIKKATPILNKEILEYHHLYLTERHEIYKRKEIQKLPRNEWTNDEVFKTYRFTNVKRELDRESKWLIKNISTNPKFDLEEKILWSILFRTFNKSKTFEKIDHFKEFNIKNITKKDIDIFREQFIQESKKDPNYVWFTAAFMTGGLKRSNAFNTLPYVRNTAIIINPDGTLRPEQDYIPARDFVNFHEGYNIVDWEKNIPTRMIRLIQKLQRKNITKNILLSANQNEVYNILLEVPGFAKFLAYQVFVDLTYIPDFPFSENEFVISGIGCSKGIDFLFEDKNGMSDEECLFWIRDNLEKIWKENGLKYYPEELFSHLPEYDRNYNLMMIENSFCELSKIVKAKRNTGRPRVKYKDRKENKESKKLF